MLTTSPEPTESERQKMTLRSKSSPGKNEPPPCVVQTIPLQFRYRMWGRRGRHPQLKGCLGGCAHAHANACVKHALSLALKFRGLVRLHVWRLVVEPVAQEAEVLSAPPSDALREASVAAG